MKRAKINTSLKLSRFYDFCKMRLEGRSDMVYRQYDLLYPHNKQLLDRPFEWMVKKAGMFWPVGGEYEVLSNLQRHFASMGYGIVSTPGCKKLVKEYYVYAKIQYENMKWATRDPDEAQMLFNANKGILDDTVFDRPSSPDLLLLQNQRPHSG